MSTLEHRLCAEVNVSVDGHQEMAGFQVSINGRFWVSTEGHGPIGGGGSAGSPFEVYRPASSAVGMFQITDGTFVEARRYCIHDHVVVEEGSWYDLRACWFNALYTRAVPGHAVEMTAALLDRTVARTVERHRIATASLPQRQDLAAIIHLCGSGAGNAYARNGLGRGQRCGDHDARRYLARVNALKREFVRLAASG